jgi:archaellum component FlaC
MIDIKLLDASIEFANNDTKDITASDFLRSKNLFTKSNQVRFSVLLTAYKPEWQDKAKVVRESKDGPEWFATHYHTKLYNVAVKIFHRKSEKKPPAKKSNFFSKKRKPTSSSCQKDKSSKKAFVERLESHPDMDEVETSVNSMAGDLKSFQKHYDKLSKSLATERTVNAELFQDNQALETKLFEYSTSLDEKRRTKKKVKCENKQLREKVAKLQPTDDALEQKTQANMRLRKEVANLEKNVESIKMLYKHVSQESSDSLKKERQSNQQICIESSQLRQELETLNRIYQMKHQAVEARLVYIHMNRCQQDVSRKVTGHHEGATGKIDTTFTQNQTGGALYDMDMSEI